MSWHKKRQPCWRFLCSVTISVLITNRPLKNVGEQPRQGGTSVIASGWSKWRGSGLGSHPTGLALKSLFNVVSATPVVFQQPANAGWVGDRTGQTTIQPTESTGDSHLPYNV